MKRTVVLFDVDGTLITTGGAGRRALELAFVEAFGEPGDFDFPFGGMTDRAILRGGLERSGHSADEAHIAQILDVYLDVLVREVRDAERYFVHPGILSAIESLMGRAGVSIGLGTGNIERGARIKLDRAELNDYFDYGGFGCDAEDRAELIACGARRGAERLGVKTDDCRLVIIGDTPKDTAAAHANQGECLAVATGGASRDDLERSGARWVFDSLEDVSVPDVLGL